MDKSNYQAHQRPNHQNESNSLCSTEHFPEGRGNLKSPPIRLNYPIQSVPSPTHSLTSSLARSFTHSSLDYCPRVVGVRSYDKYAVGVVGVGGGGGGGRGRRRQERGKSRAPSTRFFHAAATADTDLILIEWRERRGRRLLRFIFRDEREHDQLTNVTARALFLPSMVIDRPTSDDGSFCIAAAAVQWRFLLARPSSGNGTDSLQLFVVEF